MSADSTNTRLAEIEQREAWYRAKTLREFLELKKALKLREVEVDERRQDLEARDTTIHQLHAERELLHTKAHRRARYLEDLVRKLTQVERERDERAAQVARMRKTWGWSLMAPLRSLQKRFAPLPVPPVASAPACDPAPGLAFEYFLHTTPFRLFPSTAVTLLGWAFPHDRRRVTGIRARVDTTTTAGEYGLPEAEIAARHETENERLGFAIDVAVPAGRHTLGIEAELGADGWFTILSVPVWGEEER